MATRLGMVVIDATDARGLARFWATLLGWEVVAGQDDEGWVTIRGEGAAPIGFQRVASLPRVTWPEGDVAQQAHLDVYVEDLGAAAALALELGATRLEHPGTSASFAVFADPAGHPFCLCVVPEGA